MRMRSIAALFMSLLVLGMAGCGGDGGGGSGGTTVPPSSQPTKAIVKIGTAGVLPAGTLIGGVAATVV